VACLIMAGATRKATAGAITPPPAAETQPVAAEVKVAIEEALKDAVIPVIPPAIPVHVSIDTLIDALNTGEDRAETAGLRVVGPRKGRRRIGRAFGQEPVIIPLINLGEDELRSIDEDKELSWSVVPLPEDEGED